MTNRDVIPFMMGDKLIGNIEINPETAEFTGKFKKELLDIVMGGLKEGILQVAFFGRASESVEDVKTAQEKINEFINREEKKSLWDQRTER